MFEQRGGTFGCDKMFPSFTMSMAFHLLRLEVTLSIEMKCLKPERGKILDILAPR